MSSGEKSLGCILKGLPEVDTAKIHDGCFSILKKGRRKVVVLDDDPTGTQVVHDIPVFTEWGLDAVRQAFHESDRMFFILTNSRGMSSAQTTCIHREIARNLIQVIRETHQDILLISRSDSTLRGHYPLETKIINEEWIAGGMGGFDGEIIFPFFPEGGRYTIGNVHYVEQNGSLIPAAETEFARDSTFPYSHSDLCEWIQEKTGGEYAAEDVCCFSIEELRTHPASQIREKLMKVTGFGKIVVNAVSYSDLELFVIPLMEAINQGKQFLFRSAAAITKVLGTVDDRELLQKEELKDGENRNGGLVIVGSYVHKTTSQLPGLYASFPIERLEFDVRTVLNEEELKEQKQKLTEQTDNFLRNRKNVMLFTSRERFDLSSRGREAELLFSTKVSAALAEIVHNISVRPRFILAKGGITSSDIATKSLCMKQATVIGQILKGVPVWKAGAGSKFPGLPYVVFPGNVGNENSLKEAYEKLL